MMAAADPRKRRELGSPLHRLTIHYHRPGTHFHGNMAVWWRGAENREEKGHRGNTRAYTEGRCPLLPTSVGCPHPQDTHSQRSKDTLLHPQVCQRNKGGDSKQDLGTEEDCLGEKVKLELNHEKEGERPNATGCFQG